MLDPLESFETAPPNRSKGHDDDDGEDEAGRLGTNVPHGVSIAGSFD